MVDTAIKPIRLDVEETVRSKSPKLHRWIPRFLFSWLEKIIHQKEMNDFLKENSHKRGVDFAEAVMDLFDAKIRPIHEERIPENDLPYIVVSNHPLGGLDGMALIALFGRYRQNIKFPVNDILMVLKPMENVFVPVNKHGAISGKDQNLLETAFSEQNLLLYFPAGLCSRKNNGIIEDKIWKNTVFKKALRYQRPIIPVYFDGKNSKRFYNLAKFRTRLGLKFNIEMLFLPDEMFRQKGKTFNVVIGEPISVENLQKMKNPALEIRTIVYGLKTDLPH